MTNEDIVVGKILSNGNKIITNNKGWYAIEDPTGIVITLPMRLDEIKTYLNDNKISYEYTQV